MIFRRFNNVSIHAKLIVIIIISGLLVSLMASGFLVSREVVFLRRSIVEDLTGLARMLAINCTAPLEFMDSETANEILASLSAQPHILQAILLPRTGRFLPTSIHPAVPSG